MYGSAQDSLELAVMQCISDLPQIFDEMQVQSEKRAR